MTPSIDIRALRRLVRAAANERLFLGDVVRAAGLKGRDVPALRVALTLKFGGARVTRRDGRLVVVGITWR